MVSHKIVIRGTGHNIHGPVGRYISTFQMNAGLYVFHAFEISPAESYSFEQIVNQLAAGAGAELIAA
jgi:hypothetical protein